MSAPALVLPRVPEPPLANWLAAMGLADTDNASTTVFLKKLAEYEEHINQERRMTLYATAARRIDGDGVVTTAPDLAAEAALRAFMAALDGWRAHATMARAMVAILDAALTTIHAIPTGDLGAWSRQGGLWVRLRHGACGVRPLPPGAPWNQWRWDKSLKRHYLDGHIAHLIVCRERLRTLAAPGRRMVVEECAIREPDDLFGRVWPVAEIAALDARAKALGIWTGLGEINPTRRQGS